jgi:FkbM family methyltransferase
MEKIEKSLGELINNPYNDNINFNLGYAYEEEKQYAAAVSYYLRCAEYTNENILSSEALLRASLCINKQEGRDEKELCLIKHAITAFSNSIEPYYIASLYFSWRQQWLDSYMYACMGINILENNLLTKPFIKSVGYAKHEIYYQKAFSGSNIGKINEAREIYCKILSTFDIIDNTKNVIMNKLNELPEPNHTIISYSKDKLDKLKLLFNNSNKIDNNFSQIYQDMYVLSMHNGKMNGTYLEIGAGDYKNGNNTYLLETEFNWSGQSIDINKNFVNYFNKNRNNNCICSDATNIDYLDLLKNNYETENIDYLQLDCDPPNITFDILTKIPFEQYKFGVITYEHDFYNDVTGSYREKSRKFLRDYGYILIAGNISPYTDKYPFEDWWIHPDIIDENIWKIFKREDDIPINGEKYMLTKSKYIQEPIFEISNKLTTINNYHKNTSATFKLFKTCNVCDCIRRNYRWEEHQHHIIDKYLDNNSIAIEAGSHIGTIAVKLAKTCGFTYCFEPIINTYNLLEFNMNKNCIPKKFKLFNKGLGASIKNEKISWISNEGPGGIGVTNNFLEPTIQRDKIETIEIITIDSLNLDRLDYIKIDVEGYEEHVINGAIDTIKKYKPIIVLECYETFVPLKPASLEFVKDKYNLLINIGYEVQNIWNADFIFKPIEKKQQKNIISFGTDDLFKNQKIRFKQQATDINFFDNVIIEDEKSIKSLLKEHEEFIINNKRGYGYWIWKPIIIKNQLEKMKDNDILFYLDCGSSIINYNTHKLNEYIDILKDKDIIVFDAYTYLTKTFMKKNVINEFNMNNEILEKNLIEAGFIIIKKTNFSINFLNLWLDTMTKNNYSLVNDDLLNFEQNKDFIEHRHDQSILTVLARQHDNIYINNGAEELYNFGPIFHSRLTDIGPRQYAKQIPKIKNINSNSLESLCIKYNSDKVDNFHTYKGINYCNIYEKYFYQIKYKVTKFVEIGIKDACSLKMWKEYFPNAIIYGIDIDPKCKQYEEDRIKCFIGDQNDEKFLLNIKDIIGDYDILLDDGSHITEHQIKSFDILYENCRNNGYYIIEDLKCSYEEYLNHHDIRNCWPGMKYNKIDDQLKNYRKDFVKFTEDKIKKLDFHNSGKMFTIHYYPMIIIFENYSDNFSKNSPYNNHNEYSEISNNTKIYDNITEKIKPNLIVVDNFYTNPNKIREYALSLSYEPPENHGAVGYRCQSGRKIQDGTKELFEKLLHKSIPDGNNVGEWNYSTNGCFQWCDAKVPIVYHADTQQYAGIIYLTPDAPTNSGTSFLRHKKYKIRNNEIFSKSDWYQSDLNYNEPHLDKTQWEIVDSIGNVYNRLVIFDAHYIHAVTEYFGEDINNSRLFQLFFFNIN